MKSTLTMILASVMTVTASCGTLAQQDERLGRLSFLTSCDLKVQAEFERGVAMIHSYWFLSRRTFEGVLRQDPNCAIAYWGIAIDLLNNVSRRRRARTQRPPGPRSKKRVKLGQDPARARLDRGWRLLSRS